MPRPPEAPDTVTFNGRLGHYGDVRAAEGTEGTGVRTIGAQLATYGRTVHPMSRWGGAVRLADGALESPEDVNAVKLQYDHDSGRVIGAMTSIEANDSGPYGTFRMARTQDADDAFSLVQDGIIDSVSVGFAIHDARIVLEDDADVLEVTRATLFEVSLVGRPADSTAVIDSVSARKAPDMPAPQTAETPTPEAFTTAQLDALLAHVRDNMAPPATAPLLPPAITSTRIVDVDGNPVVLASERRDHRVPAAVGRDGRLYTAGEFFSTWARGHREGDWTRHNEIRQALADELTTDVPGMLPVAIVGELLGRASGRRPVWESFASRDMPMAGAKFERPKITQHVLVGDRGTEKTNPPSQKFKVLLEEVAKKVFAGGLDVSNEALDWTSPSLLNELLIDFVRIYASFTDTYASTQLVAATTAGAQKVVWDGTGPKLVKALADAAVFVAQGVGPEVDAFPNTVWIALDVWAQLAGLTDTTGRPLLPHINPMNASGTFDFTDPTSGPGGTGFRWVVGRHLPAGTFIMGDREYCEGYENGRRLLQAQNVPALGLDIAYMGYAASYFPYNKTLVAIGPAAPPEGAAAPSGASGAKA